ncbi:MAG: hypothetical protein HY078_01930 [Elusimicrobia bacterium]|nr:hypothetical protein [Elusimicrobiota bacterium]
MRAALIFALAVIMSASARADDGHTVETFPSRMIGIYVLASRRASPEVLRTRDVTVAATLAQARGLGIEATPEGKFIVKSLSSGRVIGELPMGGPGDISSTVASADPTGAHTRLYRSLEAISRNEKALDALGSRLSSEGNARVIQTGIDTYRVNRTGAFPSTIPVNPTGISDLSVPDNFNRLLTAIRRQEAVEDSQSGVNAPGTLPPRL